MAAGPNMQEKFEGRLHGQPAVAEGCSGRHGSLQDHAEPITSHSRQLANPREDAKQVIIEAAAVHEERCAGAVAKAVGELKSVAGGRSDGSLWSDVDLDVPECEQWNLALSHLKAINLQNDAEKSV